MCTRSLEVDREAHQVYMDDQPSDQEAAIIQEFGKTLESEPLWWREGALIGSAEQATGEIGIRCGPSTPSAPMS
jgi:hypothetical protein